MSYSEEQLRSAVDAVFSKFDADKSGTLEKGELKALISAALKHMNAGRDPTEQEVDSLMKTVDVNNDQKISKNELLDIFKKFQR